MGPKAALTAMIPPMTEIITVCRTTRREAPHPFPPPRVGHTPTVAVADGSGQTLSDVQAQNNPSPGDTPEGVQFPYGFFTFSIDNLANPGDAAVATLYLPKNAAIDTYYLYGPTPDDTTNHWYEFLYDGGYGRGDHSGCGTHENRAPFPGWGPGRQGPHGQRPHRRSGRPGGSGKSHSHHERLGNDLAVSLFDFFGNVGNA